MLAAPYLTRILIQKELAAGLAVRETDRKGCKELSEFKKPLHSFYQHISAPSRVLDEDFDVLLRLSDG